MSYDIIKAVEFVRYILSTEILLASGLLVVQSSLPPLRAFLLEIEDAQHELAVSRKSDRHGDEIHCYAAFWFLPRM
jgi:hypothetical protein